MSDWHPLPAYEIVLERISTKWHVTFWVHGERHACIGFTTREEAFGDVDWLKRQVPEHIGPWTETAT